MGVALFFTPDECQRLLRLSLISSFRCGRPRRTPLVCCHRPAASESAIVAHVRLGKNRWELTIAVSACN